MRKTNQHGFSPIAIILLLVIAGLISGTGYYVYNSQKNGDTNQGTVGNKDSAIVTPTPTVSPDSKSYLVIKEWGVKGEIAKGITLKYTLSAEDPNTIYLSSKELIEQAKPYCGFGENGLASETYSDGPTTGMGTWAGVYRTTNGSEQVAPNPDLLAKNLGKSINGIYYVFRPAQSACAPAEFTNMTSFKQTYEAISHFYETLVASN